MSGDFDGPGLDGPPLLDGETFDGDGFGDGPTWWDDEDDEGEDDEC
jgi:hypothetical protein